MGSIATGLHAHPRKICSAGWPPPSLAERDVGDRCRQAGDRALDLFGLRTSIQHDHQGLAGFGLSCPADCQNNTCLFSHSKKDFLDMETSAHANQGLVYIQYIFRLSKCKLSDIRVM
jgi:hypothetical protein